MDKFIREPEVLKIVGFSRSTLWRREQNDPSFPKRRKLGAGRCVGWLLSDLQSWLSKFSQAQSENQP
jgi:predicted DNA-binding transcriptional regulator AlpA